MGDKYRVGWKVQERERLFSVLDELPGFVYLQARDYTIRFANRFFWEKFGVPEKGQPCYERIFGRQAPCDLCLTFRVFETKQSQYWEWENKGRIYQVFNYPFYDMDESLLVLVFGIDITETKQMEHDLRINKEKYRQLVEYAPAGIYEVDFVKQKFTAVNDVMCEYLGYTREEFFSLNPFDILSPESKRHFAARLQRVLAGESIPNITEFKVIGKDGQEFWSLINAKYIYDNGKPVGAMVVAQDISERKRAEEALKKSETLYRTIFENTGTATIIAERDNTLSLVNTEFEKLSGYSKQETEGRKSWPEFIHRDDLEKLKDYFDRLRKETGVDSGTGPGKFECRFINKRGDVKDVMATVAQIPNTRKFVASLLDISEIKRFQEGITRLERFNLIGQMAAGIGHEVRNPMTTVRGFLQLFSKKQELAGYKTHFDLMLEELDRANSIISQFLSLAKDKPLARQKQNLNTVIITIYPLIQSDAFKYNMQINLDLQEIPDLFLDEKEIRQLLLNLTRNGIEAMASGGSLDIKTFTEDERVVLMVQDRGEGIAPHLVEKLGTPFLTTKDDGTGLGLAVCYSIASRHDADIRIETSSGGTTFMVRFKISNK